MLDREIKRVKNGRVVLIPASNRSAGHGTSDLARCGNKEPGDLLNNARRR